MGVEGDGLGATASPQQIVALVTDCTAHELLKPTAIALASKLLFVAGLKITAVGVSTSFTTVGFGAVESMLTGWPAQPCRFAPQQYTIEAALIAQVCCPPAATAFADVRGLQWPLAAASEQPSWL